MTPFDPLDPEACPVCSGPWVSCGCDPEEAEALYDLAVRTGMIVEEDAA